LFDIKRLNAHVEQLLQRRLDRPRPFGCWHARRQEPAILGLEPRYRRSIALSDSIVKRLRHARDIGDGHWSLVFVLRRQSRVPGRRDRMMRGC
jgi:hypothetical protein